MLRLIILSLRPRQWTKNLVVFAGLIFSGNAFNWQLAWKAGAAFLAFCGVVAAGYLLNDIFDLKQDRFHPVKKNRPLASGQLPVSTAVATAFALVAAALVGSLLVDLLLPLFLASYLILQFFYTAILKHLIIIDVMIIAGGFVIRAIAGAAIIHVVISPWLIVCTMLLALFLGLAKRRAELTLLAADAVNHRRNLEHYSIELVDQMISVTAAATLVSYALYSFNASESRGMMFTIPFVLYGIFRYLYLVQQHLQVGSPEKVLFTDKPLLANIILWAATAEAVLKWG